MAANTTPIFLDSGFDPSAKKCTATSLKLDGSVAGTTVVTAGADGAEFAGVRVRSHDSVTQGESILVQYYDGANRMVLGQIPVTQSVAASGATPAWEGTWFPDQPVLMVSGDIIEVGRTGASGTLVAIPYGGNF